jgi:DNA-binding transcriptional LysR family regulator
LPAIFATFRANNPGVAIELALTNRNEDLSRRDADIAVRMIRPTQSALVARRIGETRIGLYAHRDYLARAGTPASLDQLGRHRLIGFDRDDRAFRSAGALASLLSRESFGFRCDSDLAQLAALRGGVGIGGCQENIARRSPELTPVMPSEIAFTLEIWLVTHDDMKTTPRVRALFEHLAAGLTAYVRGRSELPPPL